MTDLAADYELHRAKQILRQAELHMQYANGEGPFAYRFEILPWWRMLFDGRYNVHRRMHDHINYGLPVPPESVKWAQRVVDSVSGAA